LADQVADRVVRLNPTVFLSVSGGKDSAAAAHYALKRLRDAGFNGRAVVIYAHTPLALDENLKYVQVLAEHLGAGLEVVRHRPGYGLEYIARGGMPSPHRRWCMWKWKVEPMREVMRKYPTPHVVVLGIRVEESLRRLNIYGDREEFYYRSADGVFVWLPIRDWSREQRDRYLAENNVPRNPLWGERGHSSHDCVTCIAFASKEYWQVLRANYPEKFEEILKYYRELNRNRRRGEKILAWNYVDLEEVARDVPLTSFMLPKACGCDLLDLKPAQE